MARHYYLTRSGRLRRKDNTLLFELSEEKKKSREFQPDKPENDLPEVEYETGAEAASLIGEGLGEDLLGDLTFEPNLETDFENRLVEIPEEDQELPEKVREKRVIPVEDVDSIWVFRELDLNARVLNFLAQKRIPVHFFNYYGFYSGSFYPREYLQAGFLLVRQVSHYSSNSWGGLLRSWKKKEKRYYF